MSVVARQAPGAGTNAPRCGCTGSFLRRATTDETSHAATVDDSHPLRHEGVTLRRLLGALVLFAIIVPLLSGCGILGDREITVVYEVAYADGSGEGVRARVMYRVPGGELISEPVTLPWKSDGLNFDDGASVEIFAKAPDRGAHIQCQVSTDQGPHGKSGSQSAPGGSCKFDGTL